MCELNSGDTNEKKTSEEWIWNVWEEPFELNSRARPKDENGKNLAHTHTNAHGKFQKRVSNKHCLSIFQINKQIEDRLSYILEWN